MARLIEDIALDGSYMSSTEFHIHIRFGTCQTLVPCGNYTFILVKSGPTQPNGTHAPHDLILPNTTYAVLCESHVYPCPSQLNDDHAVTAAGADDHAAVVAHPRHY